jgi:hypothetical protein
MLKYPALLLEARPTAPPPSPASQLPQVACTLGVMASIDGDGRELSQDLPLGLAPCESWLADDKAR